MTGCPSCPTPWISPPREHRTGVLARRGLAREGGLSVNGMYTIDGPTKRAVGFKPFEGMDTPAELASRFKFARQKSKLAGTIRGSHFTFKNDY
jgi:hypothetical protein